MYPNLGRKLRQERHRNQLTQQQLAEKTGICNVEISHYERGIRRPRPETLMKLCNGLSVSPFDVIADSETRRYYHNALLPIYQKRFQDATAGEQNHQNTGRYNPESS